MKGVGQNYSSDSRCFHCAALTRHHRQAAAAADQREFLAEHIGMLLDLLKRIVRLSLRSNATSTSDQRGSSCVLFGSK
jgi:hypothetical protein